MSDSNNNILLQLATKLGLAGDETLLKKSTELVRILNLKLTSNTLGDYAKTVICIDIATNLLGSHFDTGTALKISGLKKSAYSNHKRTIEKVLDISKQIGINEICVQLGLNQIQNKSAELLEQYKVCVTETESAQDHDLSHPQYAAMAIYQMCLKRKMKSYKQKLISFSHLKPAQWTLLEKNWEKVMLKFDKLPEKVKAIDITKKEDAASESHTAVKHKLPVGKKTESYEMWKKRILEKAYKDLEMRNIANLVQ